MEEVIQTVKIPLRSSNKKENKVREVISYYDDFIQYLCNIVVSYDSSDISTMNMSLYRNVKGEFKNIFGTRIGRRKIHKS